MYWKYYSGASDAHISLKECKNAFKRYRDLRRRLSNCHHVTQKFNFNVFEMRTKGTNYVLYREDLYF